MAGELISDDSPVRHTLGIVGGTLASGLFLWLIGIINVVALIGIWRVFTGLRQGRFDEAELESHLDGRGVLARILRPVMKRIKHPIQMFPVGLLFGLGFDTATEVACWHWPAPARPPVCPGSPSSRCRSCSPRE